MLLQFVYGPMLWIAFITFFLGSLIKLGLFLIQTKKKEYQIFSYMSLRYGLRSLFVWLMPFATVNMRKHPVFTTITFLFHISLILSPIFLVAHVMLVDEAFNISWYTLPDQVADMMTAIVVITGICLLVRRLMPGIANYVSTAVDYVMLVVVISPFITGFLAYHQILPYKPMILLHILSGEIMLIAIPFTKLNHMILGAFTRAYIGSEFGGVRHARDW